MDYLLTLKAVERSNRVTLMWLAGYWGCKDNETTSDLAKKRVYCQTIVFMEDHLEQAHLKLVDVREVSSNERINFLENLEIDY